MSDEEWDNARVTLRRYVEQGPVLTIDDKVLDDALYSMNERGLWPDDVTVSVEQAKMVWRLINRIQMDGTFPRELRM